MGLTRGCLYLLCFILSANVVCGHIPYYNSAEPDSPVYVNPSPSDRISSLAPIVRVTAVRSALTIAAVDAVIVPTADAHNSQFLSAADARREWVSGLRGSSGTAVVTATRALIWTDARYWTQFEEEVDGTIWELMRQGTDASVQQWLVDNMPAYSTVAVDPTTYTRSAWSSLDAALSAVNVTLAASVENLVDAGRRLVDDGPPARPNNNLLALTVEYTGQRSSEKISSLVQQMNNNGVSALLLTALDDTAYTLNLRGTDIPYNPVFFAYLVIRTDPVQNTLSNIVLFWGDGVLSSDISNHLSSEGVVVETRPYEEIFEYLKNLSTELGNERTVWLSNEASQAVLLAIEEGPANIRSTVSPVSLLKCIKNDVELEGFRTAHVKDGVAVVRALHWVEQQVATGVRVTEIEVSDKLEEFRSEEENFMGPSFETIAGAGENGAIIHYKPIRDAVTPRVIELSDMLLVDSGGHYLEGTTDITRTRHMNGTPTEAQRRAFTRVLKGQINLGATVLPVGTLGNVVEVLARKSLWDVGLNYGHGTGHGVGHYLNVHEGPAWILSGPTADDPGIAPKMIYSNEPGYYEVGEYGIRHEDLVETIEVNENADHPRAKDIVGNFDGRGAVGFHTISLAPHQAACLDIQLLNDFELEFLNSYHARVFDTIGPILQQRELTDVYEWLQRECAPIERSAAILVKSTPILAAMGVIVAYFRI